MDTCILQSYWDNKPLVVCSQFAFTAFRLYCYRYIAPHSDGGGWDAGTSYSFHPRMRFERSVLGNMFMELTPLGRILTWTIYWLANLIPGYMLISWVMWLIMVPFQVIDYFIFGYDDNMPHEYHA